MCIAEILRALSASEYYLGKEHARFMHALLKALGGVAVSSVLALTSAGHGQDIPGMEDDFLGAVSSFEGSAVSPNALAEGIGKLLAGRNGIPSVDTLDLDQRKQNSSPSNQEIREGLKRILNSSGVALKALRNETDPKLFREGIEAMMNLERTLLRGKGFCNQISGVGIAECCGALLVERLLLGNKKDPELCGLIGRHLELTREAKQGFATALAREMGREYRAPKDVRTEYELWRDAAMQICPNEDLKQELGKRPWLEVLVESHLSGNDDPSSMMIIDMLGRAQFTNAMTQVFLLRYHADVGLILSCLLDETGEIPRTLTAVEEAMSKIQNADVKTMRNVGMDMPYSGSAILDVIESFPEGIKDTMFDVLLMGIQGPQGSRALSTK